MNERMQSVQRARVARMHALDIRDKAWKNNFKRNLGFLMNSPQQVADAFALMHKIADFAAKVCQIVATMEQAQLAQEADLEVLAALTERYVGEVDEKAKELDAFMMDHTAKGAASSNSVEPLPSGAGSPDTLTVLGMRQRAASHK